MSDPDGWIEYRRLVLDTMERLDRSLAALRDEIAALRLEVQTVRSDLAALRSEFFSKTAAYDRDRNLIFGLTKPVVVALLVAFALGLAGFLIRQYAVSGGH